jgi:hypothetical protein
VVTASNLFAYLVVRGSGNAQSKTESPERGEDTASQRRKVKALVIVESADALRSSERRARANAAQKYLTRRAI